MCNDARLWQTMHPLYNLNINKAFGIYFVLELVMLNHVIGKVTQFHPQVFWSLHRHVKMKVLDVNGHKTRAQSGYHTVQQELDCEEAGRLSATI